MEETVNLRRLRVFVVALYVYCVVFSLSFYMKKK